MSISFAGQPLLMEDPAGKFSAWLDWAMDYQGFRPFAEPVYRRENRERPRGEELATARVGLPIPNYPEPPRLRLNSLYIPTGAGRWSQGLFLVDEASLARIRTTISNATDAGGTLDIAGVVMPRMFPLAPRRITETGSSAVYILPLVDHRWFWQWRDAGELVVDEETSWTDLLTQLSGQSTPSITLIDSIAAAYAQPDEVELTRRYENYAMVLDAVAASIGMRITFNSTTSAPEVRGFDFSSNVLAANLLSGQNREVLVNSTGNPSRHLVPARVRVCFPKTTQGVQTATGELFTVTVNAADYYTGDVQTDNTTQVFFDTAKAEYQDGYLVNQDELELLTKQIATDYYGWLVQQYDIAYSGVLPWTPNGFDDYVLYEINVRNRYQGTLDGIVDGDYVAITRVRSLPYNFGLREQLHQFPGPGSSSSSSSISSGSSSTEVSTGSSSSSSSSSQTETQSSSSSSTLVSTSSSSSSSQSVSESSSSGDAVYRVVQDVCCDDSVPGGGVDVCYTIFHLKWLPAHKVYGILWVEEESCSCS